MEIIEFGHESPHSSFIYPIAQVEIKDFAEKYKLPLIEIIEENKTWIEDNLDAWRVNFMSNDKYGSGYKTKYMSSPIGYNLFDNNDNDFMSELEKEIIGHVKEYNKQIYESDAELWYSCWGNRLDYMEFFQIHSHFNYENYPHDAICTSFHLTIQETCGTTNYYSPWSKKLFQGVLEIPNVEGMLTIFPAVVPHSVSSVRTKSKTRYSLAGDALTKENVPTTELWQKRYSGDIA